MSCLFPGQQVCIQNCNKHCLELAMVLSTCEELHIFACIIKWSNTPMQPNLCSKDSSMCCSVSSTHKPNREFLTHHEQEWWTICRVRCWTCDHDCDVTHTIRVEIVCQLPQHSASCRQVLLSQQSIPSLAELWRWHVTLIYKPLGAWC